MSQGQKEKRKASLKGKNLKFTTGCQGPKPNINLRASILMPAMGWVFVPESQDGVLSLK